MIFTKQNTPLILPAVMAVTAVIVLAGCTTPLISYIAGQLQRPKKVEAKYELPGGKVVLVLVENRTDARSYENIKRKLTNALNAQLVEQGLASSTIPYDDIMRFRLSTPGYHRMKITEVCSRLGADLVIYVHIDRFLLKDDTSDVWRGQIATTVFVKNRNSRLWPDDLPGGYVVKPIERRPSTSSSPTYGDRLAGLLAGQMADRIAKLFYDHRLSGVDAYEGKATDDSEKMLQ